MPRVGIDVSSFKLTVCVRFDGRDDELYIVDYSKPEREWQGRLQAMGPALRQFLSSKRSYGQMRALIEEPVIGKGARSSMLVGVFAGAAFGILEQAEHRPALVHPTTWRKGLANHFGISLPRGAGKDWNEIVVRDHLPQLARKIDDTIPAKHQPDMYDAVGIAYADV